MTQALSFDELVGRRASALLIHATNPRCCCNGPGALVIKRVSRLLDAQIWWWRKHHRNAAEPVAITPGEMPMSSQTDKPPAWGTLAYWEWVKERYLSEKQCRFARILAEEAECGRAYVLARRAELQDADAQEVAQEYCLSIFQARPTYDA